jgi:hypothetical protein
VSILLSPYFVLYEGNRFRETQSGLVLPGFHHLTAYGNGDAVTVTGLRAVRPCATGGASLLGSPKTGCPPFIHLDHATSRPGCQPGPARGAVPWHGPRTVCTYSMCFGRLILRGTVRSCISRSYRICTSSLVGGEVRTMMPPARDLFSALSLARFQPRPKISGSRRVWQEELLRLHHKNKLE